MKIILQLLKQFEYSSLRFSEGWCLGYCGVGRVKKLTIELGTLKTNLKLKA